MKAVVVRQHGGPEQLRVEEWPEPAIGPEDALIRVRACALNHLDLWARSGPPENIFPWRERPLPTVGGVDVAGVVERVGERVTDLEPGTRVVNMNHLGRALTDYADPPVNVLFVYNANPAATVTTTPLMSRMGTIPPGPPRSRGPAVVTPASSHPLGQAHQG